MIFSEFQGPELLVSDILIFPIIQLVNETFGIIEKYPHITSWLSNMTSSSNVQEVFSNLVIASNLDPSQDLSPLTPAPVPDESLYKCDPSRRPQSSKAYTRQTDINNLLDWWDESDITSLQQHSLPHIQPLDWSSLPQSVHPQAGTRIQDDYSEKNLLNTRKSATGQT